MKIFFVGGILILVIITGLFFAQHSLGQTQTIPTSTSDFAIAVQAGLRAVEINSVAQSQQQEIKNQDYKSAWDEFGVNKLVDGNMPPDQVQNQIAQDIIQSVETAQNYNQQEADYLQATQNTPEQVQAAENSVGVDLPPDQTIDANPSIDANPGVSISPADTQTQENIAGNTFSSDTGFGNKSTSTDKIIAETSAVEPSSSIQRAGISVGNAVVDSAVGMNTSTADMGVSSSESAIYDAILQGELTQYADQAAPATDNGANQSSTPDNTFYAQ